MTKRNNQPSILWLILAVSAFILLMNVLLGCNAERKALKPYKAVNSDVSPEFKEKKKELIARVCAVNFPIEVKTIIKDSTITKIVRVQDNKLVNELKKKLSKGCPTLNIDSIYNELPFDTIYIDRWHKSEQQGKDTISLYNMANSNSDLHNKVNALNADISILNKHIEDLNKDINDANKLKDKWKWRCILACMFIVGSWGLYGYFKIRKSLMPKI